MKTHRPENARSRTQAFVCLTVAMSGMLLTSGCGIPALRRALPGPATPSHYSLNNGTMFWTPNSSANAGTKDDASKSGSQGFFRSIRLASLIKPGSSADNDQASPVDRDSVEWDSSQFETTEFSAATDRNRDLLQVSVQQQDTDAETTATETSDFDITPLPLSETAVGEVQNSSQLPLSSFFDDPHLLGLVSQALTGNQELRILSEEINISCNEVYARSGEYRPFVTLGAGAGLEKSSRFSRDGAVEDQLLVAPGRGFPEPLPDFLMATTVSWELDIWNKLRNAQSAAAMRYLGSQEGRNYITTRLVAEVAENYYELLALDNRLMALNKTIEIQERSLKVAEGKKKAGRGTELAVQRFQAEVRKNQSEIMIIQQEIVEAENRINLLAGRYPQPVERASVEYIDLNLNSLATGLPSELLRNRADIRQAEKAVAAAGLDVQVAKARFYPSLGLRAGIGLNAHNMRYLLSTPESLIYNAAVDLVGPLINKRAIKADYCSANAAQLQSIYHYQQTVLMAHIEVVNHMTKVENYRQSIEVKKQQLEALEASVDTASKLFQNARAEYVEVLLAQREMMEARIELIETKQQQLQAIVNAYQALGGGGF